MACHYGSIGEERLRRAGLWMVALCPLILAIARHSTLYDAWRHLLFIYPPLVVLAAIGWRDVMAATREYRLLPAVAAAALIAGCTEPLRFMVRSHPNEVVYFNALVGGPRGAFKEFELDYWGNSLLQATAWNESVAECAGRPLAVSGWPFQLVVGDVSRFPMLRATYPEEEAHHLEVQLLRGTRDGLRRTMARRDILHVVRTGDGAPLAVVLPGPRFPEVQRILVAARRGSDGTGTDHPCAAIRDEFGQAIASVQRAARGMEGRVQPPHAQ